jgi:mannose-6-phosphate isomerase-like protein (cupin superfamily)
MFAARGRTGSTPDRVGNWNSPLGQRASNPLLCDDRAMPVRRVVTGQLADGRSVFVADEALEPISVALMPGTLFERIWGSDDPVVLPTNGVAPPATRFFPPAEGFRFLVWTIGPAGASIPDDIDIAAAVAAVETTLPGLIDHNEPDDPGMHTTDTIDFDYVVSGEVILELDDGATVHLRAGDCVVQNGTRHRWTNPSAEPCTIVTTLVGARRHD